MALTSKITNVANKIRDLTGTTGKMTLDEMPSKMDEIKTKPNLQDKSIEITENGTQTIQADEGYDGLNNVNVDVNITGGIVNDNLNIFIQEEEPNIKNGVWLKTNKSYESIEFYNVDDIFEWSIDANDDTIIPYVKEIGVTSIGTDIFIAGGMTYNNVYKNTMYKYDTLTNTYTKLTNLPYSAYGISIISYETDIYIFGGRNNGSTCYNYAYKYDTLSDIYTKLTNMPASIGQTGIARVGTNIYIIGGSINGGGQVSSVYKYDILTDTYTTLEPLPIIRNCPAVCTLDTDIYIFCGFNGEWLKDSYKYASNVNSYVIESIEMVDTIKSLSLQNKVCYDVEQKYSKLNENNYSLTRIINIEEFFKNLVFHIGNLIIIYLGVLQVREGNLLITSLITYMNLLGYFTEPIKNIIDLNLVYKNARESLRRILELYQVPCEEIDYNKKYHLDKLKGNIIVNNLSYSYNGINKVIDNVSFEIKAGEKVLIYGSSGSGKSTIMKLLVKYLQGYQGEIRLDGYNLQSLDLYDIRTKICYVSQKENLFTDSIYNNIVLDREISYETFMDITKTTYVEELVSSKNLNYHYLLEENGFNLSGGERQKIILARTLLQEADIYIFDEALNAIAVNKERMILENIFNLYKDKTIIVVSHRFNNNDLFDKKIVIKGDIK